MGGDLGWALFSAVLLFVCYLFGWFGLDARNVIFARRGLIVVQGPVPLASLLPRVLLLSSSGCLWLASFALLLLCYLPHLPHLLCSSLLYSAALGCHLAGASLPTS